MMFFLLSVELLSFTSSNTFSLVCVVLLLKVGVRKNSDDDEDDYDDSIKNKHFTLL